MKLWRCTCGMTFDAKHRLTNHIGYAILLDSNASNHKPIQETKPVSLARLRRDQIRKRLKTHLKS